MSRVVSRGGIRLVEDLHARIDDSELPVTPDAVLVLWGCGPEGTSCRACPGVRRADERHGARHGGAPCGAGGCRWGPLAWVQDGDPIVLDVPRRLLQLDVAEDELVRRIPAPSVTEGFAAPDRGWERLYVDHVQQVDTGADLDFLLGASGPGVARESH